MSWINMSWMKSIPAQLSLLAALGAGVLTVRTSWNEVVCRDAGPLAACAGRADGEPSASSPQATETLYIVAPLLPPNMRDDRTGREAEIIRAALEKGEARALRIRFVVQPFARHWFSYQNDPRFGAVTTVPDTLQLSGYRSKHYVMYRNGIGAMAESGLRDLAQLEGKRVVTFPGASQFIGDLAKLPRDYFGLLVERPDQAEHSEMLLSGQVDAVIADAMIFQHYNREQLGPGASLPTFTDAFKPTCYAMVFRNADFRDAFDRGLTEMIRGNLLRPIDERYVQSLGLGADIHYVEDGREPCSS